MINKYSFSFTSTTGPKSDIQLSPAHGGPILCMDINKDMIITGSTDHGLRVYSLSTGNKLRNYTIKARAYRMGDYS